MKNDGRLSSGRASAWIAAWLETQGFFLLFAILRPTLFTGKRGLYFKSETWTKSLVVEFEQGRGRTASSRQDWVFSPIRPKHPGAHWKVFYFRETSEMCFDCSGYGRSGGPTCSVELGENQGVLESMPCSSTHHRIVLVQGITTHFKDLLYYHQKMFAQKELSTRNGLKYWENWSNHFLTPWPHPLC